MLNHMTGTRKLATNNMPTRNEDARVYRKTNDNDKISNTPVKRPM